MEIEKPTLESKLDTKVNVDYVEVVCCERCCAMFDYYYFIKYLFIIGSLL